MQWRSTTIANVSKLVLTKTLVNVSTQESELIIRVIFLQLKRSPYIALRWGRAPKILSISKH
ncbi:hypothetical protein SAMD00079811_67040 [Scytonema sp. HK-05]|nr:hypothetical protein SAMD00079811_67040 [Scytonema sp. HK-05]